MSTESDRLAREAEERRARLDQTLENLKTRMSPGQIVDEAMGYLREGQGADMARNLNRQVRDNPLALGLIGAGAAWLLFGQGVRGEADRLRSHDDGYGTAGTGRVGYVAGERAGTAGTSYSSYGASSSSSSTGGGIGAAASSAGDRMSSAASSVRDAAGNAAGRVSDTASSIGDGGRRALHDASDAVSGAADATRRGLSDAGGRIAHAGSRARRSVLDTIQEEPLILGAVALAVGAAIGAALPSTRVEDEWLGRTRDGLRDDALAYGKGAVERAGEVASHVASAAGEEADRQGLVPKNDGSKPVAERVGDVVRTAADTAREDARKEGLV